ncbi:MAG: alpha/beta hydrolase [Gemmatimonadetes bacterium]|nr:alpha/beta hydrolase [Gemmatimonadota bacterium]
MPRPSTLPLALTVALAACGGSAAPAPIPAPIVVAPPATVVTPPPKPPAPRSAARRSWAALDTGAMRVPIFVVTLRRPVTSDRPGDRFGGDDADSLQYAVAQVNVPGYAVRRQGETPRPPATRVSRFWYRPDSSRDMYVRDLAPSDQAAFIKAVGDALAGTASRSLLLFVHGYNVAFDDAAIRAAQVAADTDLDGVVVIFDWPSAGAMSSYVRDQQAARNAGFHFARFLKEFPAAVEADRTLLVAHSMGSEVVSRAVTVLGDSVPTLTHAVFAAPDVDARVFRREVLPRLAPKARRVTVYASNEDEALRASRVLNGVWRLGLGGDSLVVLKDMDTIDATRVRGDFLGHTLFINGSVLADLHELLANDRAPGERRLLPIKRDSLTFWRFRSESR